MENQPKSFPVGSAQLCISGLQFKCRLCDKKNHLRYGLSEKLDRFSYTYL
jgi:hypothetical protein